MPLIKKDSMDSLLLGTGMNKMSVYQLHSLDRVDKPACQDKQFDKS